MTTMRKRKPEENFKQDITIKFRRKNKKIFGKKKKRVQNEYMYNVTNDIIFKFLIKMVK